MKQNLKHKIWILFITVIFLTPVIGTEAWSNGVSSCLSGKSFANGISNDIEMYGSTGPTVDLKIRKPGGDWQDQHLTCDVGTEVEFKIVADLTIGDYVGVIITTALPVKDDDILKPMFNFIRGSASPIPDEEEGAFYATNLAVIWGWVFSNSNWHKEMTFKAKVVRSGTATIHLVSMWMVDEDDFDTVEDTVKITGKSGCCFPAGTKITMADGSYKNIEDIHFGDRILSYDIKNCRFTSWRVKLLGHPIHPVYEINDGLLSFTKDHPIFVKKPDGTTGWGAADVNAAKTFTRLKNDILTIVVGDQIYTADEKWIEITNIEFKPEPVQTYNIMSFSGTKTYFANDVLVFEENPPLSIWRANNFYMRGYIEAWINALLDLIH